jgi:hypothetical protein
MESKNSLNNMKTCPTCNKAFSGRRNQKYCSPNCKTDANNQIARIRNQRVSESIRVYRKNVEILIQLYEAGVRNISLDQLEDAGFKKGICENRKDTRGKMVPGFEEITIFSTEKPFQYILNHENDSN